MQKSIKNDVFYSHKNIFENLIGLCRLSGINADLLIKILQSFGLSLYMRKPSLVQWLSQIFENCEPSV